MQYLLTEEEFQNRVPKITLYPLETALSVARQKLLDLTEFPCIHATASQNEYCDLCPCIVTRKEKDAMGIFSDKVEICRLDKNYSR